MWILYVGFADDEDLDNSQNPSPDQGKAQGEFEDPELYEIAKKLKELEASDSDEDILCEGDWSCFVFCCKVFIAGFSFLYSDFLFIALFTIFFIEFSKQSKWYVLLFCQLLSSCFVINLCFSTYIKVSAKLGYWLIAQDITSTGNRIRFSYWRYLNFS